MAVSNLGMTKRSIIPEQKDEYLGNMWGWKFSFIGLGLLLFLLSLMAYRHCQIKEEPVQEQIEQLGDKK